MRSGFFGRQEELAWLRERFESCGVASSGGGPRMVLLVAESGIGKSRLVQELYLSVTSDPRWDPPDVDYWPEAFRGGGEVLRVTPDMAGHKAKGPPKFIWLGARCIATDEPNGRSERSILPGIRSSLMVHAEIVRAHQSLWSEGTQRLAAALKKETAGEAMGQAADYVAAAVAQLPCGGLVAKLAIGSLKLACDRLRGPVAYEEILQKHTASDRDELLECFGLLFNAQSRVPVILWLDDAQWLDHESLLFLKELWAEATRRRWPLFVVVTHWEREWRERASDDVSGSLHQFCAFDTVEVLQLAAATDATLSACVNANLPGLTESQVRLMVEKAAGNFLQLFENIGQLAAEPMNFEEERIDGPLTAEAVEYVKHFESDREKRIRQRFQAFESEVKKVLGWSSQLGTRFLSDVIQAFAEYRLGRSDAGELIARCIDPYVVLESPSALTREFRDKVFHRVADEFRRRYLLTDHLPLSNVLRTHLMEWLSTGVTPEGRIVDSGTAISGARSLAALPTEERRDLLGCALSEFTLPPSPDWSIPEHKAALWATCLAIDTDSRDAIWGRVRLHLERLNALQWATVPLSICSVEMREGIATAAISCGQWQLALDVLLTVLHEARQAVHSNRTSETLVSYGDTLQQTGDVERVVGRLGDAMRHHRQAHVIRKKVLSAEPTPANKRSVVESLNRIGDLEQARGRPAEALRAFQAMLAMTEELEAEDGRLLNLLDRSVAITRIADMMCVQGREEEALVHYEKALSIRRSLLDRVKGPVVLEYISNSLERIGDIELSHGHSEDALLRFRESLEIRRGLLADEDLPAHRRAVAASLNRVGDVLQEAGQWAEARVHFEEMLEHLSEMATKDVTPQRLRDISVALGRIAKVAEEAGQRTDALYHYEEALRAAKLLLETEEPFDASYSVVWLSHRIAAILASDDIDAAMEFTNEQLSYVERLEGTCGDNYDYLLKCAQFWETRAEVSDAVGDIDEGIAAQERVARIVTRLRAMD